MKTREHANTTPQGKPKHSTSKPAKTILAAVGNAKRLQIKTYSHKQMEEKQKPFGSSHFSPRDRKSRALGLNRTSHLCTGPAKGFATAFASWTMVAKASLGHARSLSNHPAPTSHYLWERGPFTLPDCLGQPSFHLHSLGEPALSSLKPLLSQLKPSFSLLKPLFF